MGVIDRIVEHAHELTVSERKVAEVLSGDPQAIAFGTVAEVARRAGTSGPSVVRLAVKLGYAGFVEMQGDVQQELARLLAPAHDRIRQRPPSDLMTRTRDVEFDNVEQSLANVSSTNFAETVARLADRRRHVWIAASDHMRPVGLAMASHLGQLRDGVELLDGSEVAISRRLAGHGPHDALVAIDTRRYERWLLSLATFAASQSIEVTALTDSPLSPLVAPAKDAYFFAAQGVGPFDSLVGALAVVNILVAAVAGRVRPSATSRLNAIENAWTSNSLFVAGSEETIPLTALALPPTDNNDSASDESENSR